MHVKRTIVGDPGSYALLSGRSGADTAVFFVHGFNGSAVDTWIDFQNLVDEDEEHAGWWARCDLYFWQYPSVFGSVAVQAARFRDFLQKYFPAPAIRNLVDPSGELMRMLGGASVDALPVTFQYKRLVLVGHSLGGVIIRQALVDEAVEFDARHISANEGSSLGQEGCLSAAVRLFAPAIFGFDPTQFGGFCYNLIVENPVMALFLKPLLRSNPVHSELAQGSQRLLEIRRRTEGLAAKYPWMHGLRAHLIFGATENVVYIDRYDCDPVYRIAEGQDHKSISKPIVRYREPLEFVSYGLSRTASV